MIFGLACLVDIFPFGGNRHVLYLGKLAEKLLVFSADAPLFLVLFPARRCSQREHFKFSVIRRLDRFPSRVCASRYAGAGPRQ